jgi:hypothetical protein
MAQGKQDTLNRSSDNPARLGAGYLETVVEPVITTVNVIRIGFFTTSTEGWR